MVVLRSLFIAVLISLVAWVSTARADWLKAESEHFVVYGDMSEREMRNQVQKLEKFDQLLRLYLPPTSDYIAPKLPIYLTRSKSEMRQVWPDIPSQVGGFYARGDERIFAVVGNDRQGDATLLHEYVHHYMFQNFTAPYPSWFIEGFAEYFATADIRSDRITIGLHSPGRMNSLSSGGNTWAPMEAVLGRGNSRGPRIAGHQFYAQSWALTHYLLSTPERLAMLSTYLRAVSNGSDPIESMTAATGQSPGQLQSAVMAYLGRITTLTPQIDYREAEVSARPLSNAERDAIWLDLRLARFVPEERRAENLVEARRLAERHPGAPIAAQVLAQAHLDMKQPSEATSILRASLETQPDVVQTMRMLAISLMDEADALENDPDEATRLYNEARALLAKAYQQDASDFRIYLAIARSREKTSGYPNGNDTDTLVYAAELAPQLPTARMRAAQALIHNDRHEEAISWLRPIASDPHGSSANLSRVRALLTKAYAGAGRAATGDATADDVSGDDNSDVVRPDDEAEGAEAR